MYTVWVTDDVNKFITEDANKYEFKTFNQELLDIQKVSLKNGLYVLVSQEDKK